MDERLRLIGMAVRSLPSLLGNIYRAVRAREEADRRYREGYRRVRQLPLESPALSAIPAKTVDSIEEYLEHLARFPREWVFRGQSTLYALTQPDSISLLPMMARPRYTSLVAPGRNVEKAFERYADEVVLAHLRALGCRSEEARLFLQGATGDFPMGEAYYLSKTAQGQFIRPLYPPFKLPYAYQASLQHYGYPTLGLDVTFSPLVALFFAMHQFHERPDGALACRAAEAGGVVYVIHPSRDDVVVDPEMANLPGARRPAFADLADYAWDSDTRARRQHAAFLCRLIHVDLDSTPHFNSYAFDIVEIIRLSERFWQDASTRRFLAANMAGWFFPGPRVDRLAEIFEATGDPTFTRYAVGPLQDQRDPRGQYEYLQLRRVVLTGSDTTEVTRLLAATWYGRKGLLEVMPIDRVLDAVAKADETLDLDVVVTCEPTKEEGNALASQIRRVGRGPDRWFGLVDASPLGRKVDPHGGILMKLGGEPHWFSDDPYDSDAALQRKVQDAGRQVHRFRYERRMKPSARDWHAFLPQSFGVGA